MTKPIPTKTTPAWVDVPYLETTDRVVGGLAGASNASALALHERTDFIKKSLTALESATPVASAGLSLDYSGNLTTGTLFSGVDGLPNNAVVTSVLIANAGEAQVFNAEGKQLLQSKNIHIEVTGGGETTVVGTGLPAAVEAGEWVPSPNKEPLAAGKFMGAYWGDYTTYKPYGAVTNGVPEKYWSLDYITNPDMAGGNVAPGETRIPLAQQLSNIYYAFFFPNCSFGEWKRFMPFMDVKPPCLFGTIEDAVAKGGANRGEWSASTAYNVNDVVTKDGVTYAAFTANTGQDPKWKDTNSGVSSEWISGSYVDPAGIPIPAAGATNVPAEPLEPGVGYTGVVYTGTIRPCPDLYTLLQVVGVGPGIVWKTPDGKFWVAFTWAGYYDLAAVDGSQHSMIAGTPASTAHRQVFWRTIIPRGALVPSDKDTWQTFLSKLPALRIANPNLKLCFSLGGWSMSHFFSVVFADPVLRAVCIDSCLTYARKAYCDGIDLDWETPGGNGPTHNVVNGVWPDFGDLTYPATVAGTLSNTVNQAQNANSGPATGIPGHPSYIASRNAAVADPTVDKWDKNAYTYFIRDLKAAFVAFEAGVGGRKLEVSCAIIPGDYGVYNTMDAFQYMDHIMLMSYIFYGSWQTELLPFAGLYKANSTTNTLLTVHGFAQRLTNATDAVGGDGRLGTVKLASGVATPWSGGTFECLVPKSKVIIGTTSNGVGYLSSNFTAAPVAGTTSFQVSGNGSGVAPAWRPPQYSGIAGWIDEDAMYHRYLTGEFQRYWDKDAKVAWYTKDLGNGTREVYSADDVIGLWHKADYTVTNGYGGMMVWELSGDTKHNTTSWVDKLGGRVEDVNGKQFNNIDTMVSVLNMGATSGGSGNTATGSGTVVFSRSANTAAGIPILATCTVGNLAAVGVKITYELVEGGTAIVIAPPTTPTTPTPVLSSITTAANSTALEGTDAIVTFTLSPALVSNAQVTVNLIASNMVSGADYSGVMSFRVGTTGAWNVVANAATVTIPTGASAFQLKTEILNDAVYADTTGSLIFSASRVSANLTGSSVVNQTVTIQDTTAAPPPPPPVLTSSFYWYGDSLSTVQWNNTGVGPALSALLNTPVTVKANGGMMSQEVAIAFSGRSSEFTLEGNMIPASGSVNVTSRTLPPIGYVMSARQADPAFSTAIREVPGTLAGVHGIYSSDGGRLNFGAAAPTYWRFTRSTPGTEVAVSPNTPFIIDITNNHLSETCIFWAGTNNISWWYEEYGVMNDIAGCVAAMANTPKRLIIISPITMPGWNTDMHAQVAYITNEIAAVYPTNSINVMQLLLANGDGSPEDNADIAANIPPRSLRLLDDGHLNSAGSALVAKAVYQLLTTKGWVV